MVSKELHDSYVEYVLLYDTIANRITINEVRAEKGKLRLMKNVWWEYDKLPHMLIAGGTGGGKTYFILTIIEALLRCDSVMYVLDPKNADLADLAAVMPEVYYRKEDITACIDRFFDGMMGRSETMKLMKNYKTGENYAYLGLPPHFLIFDEYVAFMEMLTTKENAAVLNKLKQIVMLGWQAGFFLKADKRAWLCGYRYKCYLRSESRRYGLACAGAVCRTCHMPPVSNRGAQIQLKTVTR